MEKIEELIKETTNSLILHLDHKPGDRKFIEGTLENFRNLVVKGVLSIFPEIPENNDVIVRNDNINKDNEIYIPTSEITFQVLRAIKYQIESLIKKQ